MEKKYDRLTKEIAYPIISKYFKSGLSAYLFYEKVGMTKSQFFTWRRRYMQDHNMPLITDLAEVAADSSFHPIRVSVPEQPDDICGQIELEYPNGVILRMEATLSDLRLASLIKLY